MPEQLKDSGLMGLIQSIYETTLHPEEWNAVLADIVSAAGASGGCMLSLEGGDEFKSCIYSTGLNRAALSLPAHQETIYKISMPLATGSRLVLSFRRNGNLPWLETLRDCFGEDGEVLLILLAKDGRRRISLLLYFDRCAEKSFESCEGLIMAILPHLQMAIAVQRDRNRDASRIELLDEAFASSNRPTAIISQDLRIVIANARFTRLLNLCPDQFRVREGVLEFKDEIFAEKLHSLLQKARMSGHGSHFSWVRGATGRSWIIAINRLENGEIDGRVATLFPEQAVRYMLVIGNLSEDFFTPPHAIGSLFGLTATEADLVFALANGDSPADIARSRGVSKNTVHNQLASAMARIGVHRQSQLTSLLSTVNCVMQ